jgi:hypothetical protein
MRAWLLCLAGATAGCGAAGYDDPPATPVDELPDVWLVALEPGAIDHPRPRRTRWEVVEIRLIADAALPTDGIRLVLDGVPLPTGGLGGDERLHVALPGREHQLELVVDDRRGAPVRGALRFETTSACRTLLDARLPSEPAQRAISFFVRPECLVDDVTAAR